MRGRSQEAGSGGGWEAQEETRREEGWLWFEAQRGQKCTLDQWLGSHIEGESGSQEQGDNRHQEEDLNQREELQGLEGRNLENDSVCWGTQGPQRCQWEAVEKPKNNFQRSLVCTHCNPERQRATAFVTLGLGLRTLAAEELSLETIGIADLPQG